MVPVTLLAPVWGELNAELKAPADNGEVKAGAIARVQVGRS